MASLNGVGLALETGHVNVYGTNENSFIIESLSLDKKKLTFNWIDSMFVMLKGTKT